MADEYLSCAPFGVLAPILCDFGYQCIPIRPGSKAPMLEDWQGGHAPEYYLPHRAADGAVTDCAEWGTGVLTRTTPAIDLDIRDRDVVKLLIRLAEDMLEPGPSPIRVGQFPKTLLPFATDQPFEKITSRGFALPGEDWTVAGFRGHRVEVLGDGQQFVAYAIHPGTRRPYKWGSRVVARLSRPRPRPDRPDTGPGVRRGCRSGHARRRHDSARPRRRALPDRSARGRATATAQALAATGTRDGLHMADA